MVTKNDTLTPMMRQYRRIRSELADDVILLFRLGDFYEMFFEDAQVAAPILNVALTKRGGVPMCGVPYHALDGYLSKLILAGRKAALCEQMEDPATTKGIVRREVTRIVTPGTIIEHEMLDAARNNYLAAIYRSRIYGLALLDLSTGEFAVEELDNSNVLRDLLRRYAPSECLIGHELYADAEIATLLTASGIKTITATEDWLFEPDIARDRLLCHFGVHSLDGFGCEGRAALIGPAGALLHYVSEELHHNGNHIRHLQVLHNADILMLDEATCSNLDLLPAPGKAKEATLFGVLDNTLTPMGARLLRSWILRPFAKKIPLINASMPLKHW